MLSKFLLDPIEALLGRPLLETSISTARYLSARGFAGGLIAGSTFVLLPMPKIPVVVAVVALGLY